MPTVDIGDRQNGRIRCDNVIHCEANTQAITEAMKTALTFVQKAHATVSPYFGGDTSGKIVSILETALADPSFGAPKGFYDGNA